MRRIEHNRYGVWAHLPADEGRFIVSRRTMSPAVLPQEDYAALDCSTSLNPWHPEDGAKETS